jgi:hypothetical protein
MINARLETAAENLDAVEELRRLQTPIPTKADVIREAVMEAGGHEASSAGQGDRSAGLRKALRQAGL